MSDRRRSRVSTNFWWRRGRGETPLDAEDRGKPPLQGRDRGLALVPRDDLGIGDDNASAPPFDDAAGGMAKIEHPMRFLPECEGQQEAVVDPDAGEWREATYAAAGSNDAAMSSVTSGREITPVVTSAPLTRKPRRHAWPGGRFTA